MVTSLTLKGPFFFLLSLILLIKQTFIGLTHLELVLVRSLHSLCLDVFVLHKITVVFKGFATSHRMQARTLLR